MKLTEKLTERGFTIIELMVATAVFTILLLITTTTIIGISSTYIKGSVEGQTQQTARSILNDISQDIQFNQPPFSVSSMTSLNPGNDTFFFCIGNDVYIYQLDQVQSTSTPIFIRYSGSCPSPPVTVTVAGAASLMSKNERLGYLNISQSTVNGYYVYTISIEVGYSVSGTSGNSLIHDLTNQGDPPAGNYKYGYQCQSGSDSNFCAVSTLTTTVTSRITGN
ncbi:MAG: prepilin-type N-terminal cleavage/methylation domain-containing protein [Candidatus Saccharibacteria bacterium]